MDLSKRHLTYQQVSYIPQCKRQKERLIICYFISHVEINVLLIVGRIGKFVRKSTDFSSVYKSLKVETETLMINYHINDQNNYLHTISADSSVTVLSHHAVLYNRDSVVTPGLDHPVHLLPLTGEGVELKDVVIVDVGTVIDVTA